MMQLTARQLAALRRIRTASGVWRHFVQSNGLGVDSFTWQNLLAAGVVERRKHDGRLSRYAYRLTDAGHEQVAMVAARDTDTRKQSDSCNFDG